MHAAEGEIAIQYEGPGVAQEIWGATQANFVVLRPHHAAKEVAVMLNDKAVQRLAREFGVADTPEFREGAARFAGRAAIQRLWDRRGRLDSAIVVSAATLDEDPTILEELRHVIAGQAAAVAASERMAPQH